MSNLGEWDEDTGEALTPPVQDNPPAEPVLQFQTVDEFVRDFLCPMYRRNVGQQGRAQLRWSAKWWESAEAIMRLEALWRSWEHLRQDPALGISVWFRDHADIHMAALMSPEGPWRDSEDTARASDPLPYEPPPEGLFVPYDEDD